MRRGHHAMAAPFAIGYAYGGAALEVVHPVVAVGGAVLVVWSSTWPDYDHPRFKGKFHPVAAAVRGSARLGYMIRTPHDRRREDQHRGPSHCLEWCLLLGLALLAPLLHLGVPLGAAAFVAGAVTLGTASHIAGDVMTPSGVPLSALYNVLAYRGDQRQVWRRHALGWFVTDSASERIGAVPLLYLATLLEGLALVGGLPLAWDALTGGMDPRPVLVLAGGGAVLLATVKARPYLAERTGAPSRVLAANGVVYMLAAALVVFAAVTFGAGWSPWA